MILRNFISLRAFTVYMENSLRFEISFRSIWPEWNLHRSEFHYARSHVSADNEVTSPKWNFIPKWNLKPVWVHVGSHVNMLLIKKYITSSIKSKIVTYCQRSTQTAKSDTVWQGIVKSDIIFYHNKIKIFQWLNQNFTVLWLEWTQTMEMKQNQTFFHGTYSNLT